MILGHPTPYGRRQPDGAGAGHFGAPRGHRKHRGVDFASCVAMAVFAPCSGIISRIGWCYADDPQYRLIEIRAERCVVSVFYVEPDVVVGDSVKFGDVIGLAQNISARYAGMNMTNHVHMEMYLADDQALIGRLGTDPTDRVYVNPELFF